MGFITLPRQDYSGFFSRSRLHRRTGEKLSEIKAENAVAYGLLKNYRLAEFEFLRTIPANEDWLRFPIEWENLGSFCQNGGAIGLYF